MKAVLFAAALMTTAAVAHAGEMMKGMEMKDMSPSAMGKDAKAGKHVAKGTVKSVDAKAGTVTLDHEPVKSMSWPAMSMTFQVKDKALMDKLAQGRKVEVEFEQRGKEYVITSAR
jgi:Cu(I)/Ag(I) efflux system periplasmic protein CusF